MQNIKLKLAYTVSQLAIATALSASLTSTALAQTVALDDLGIDANLICRTSGLMAQI